MTSFAEAMRKLTTAQGEPPESIPRLSAAILGLVPGAAAAKAEREARAKRALEGFTEEQEALAAELARTTIFSHAQWVRALAVIGNGPDRDALIEAIGHRAAMNGAPVDVVAAMLCGDEDTPGSLASLRKAYGGEGGQP